MTYVYTVSMAGTRVLLIHHAHCTICYCRCRKILHLCLPNRQGVPQSAEKHRTENSRKVAMAMAEQSAPSKGLESVFREAVTSDLPTMALGGLAREFVEETSQPLVEGAHCTTHAIVDRSAK